VAKLSGTTPNHRARRGTPSAGCPRRLRLIWRRRVELSPSISSVASGLRSSSAYRLAQLGNVARNDHVCGTESPCAIERHAPLKRGRAVASLVSAPALSVLWSIGIIASLLSSTLPRTIGCLEFEQRVGWSCIRRANRCGWAPGMRLRGLQSGWRTERQTSRAGVERIVTEQHGQLRASNDGQCHIAGGS
jgi:hypothetical protein